MTQEFENKIERNEYDFIQKSVMTLYARDKLQRGTLYKSYCAYILDCSGGRCSFDIYDVYCVLQKLVQEEPDKYSRVLHKIYKPVIGILQLEAMDIDKNDPERYEVESKISEIETEAKEGRYYF